MDHLEPVTVNTHDLAVRAVAIQVQSGPVQLLKTRTILRKKAVSGER